MRLIAKKPCRFGGKDFFINDQIPEELVLDAEEKEKIGLISIIKDAEAVETGVIEAAEFDGKVMVPIIEKEEGDTASVVAVPLSEGEVQTVFSIMQMGVPEAEKAIEEITSDEVLIVLHACDYRSGVKKAAKKRADNLFSKDPANNESVSGIEFSEDITESAEEK